MNNNVNKKQSIGVFDSGVGGLNVLSNLVEAFPNENFIYVGDNLNVPYGVKTKQQLEEIISKVFRYFEKQDVKAIIVACNTASVASEDLKCSVPVFRIIEPTAKRAKAVSNNIGVLATNFTIESKGYDKYLEGYMKGIKASAFVPIVEKNIIKEEESQKVIKDILLPYKNYIDSIILGCTHFSLLEEDIINVLGDVKIIDSSKSFNEVIKSYLDENDLNYNDNKERFVQINFTKEDKINIGWFKHQYQGINFIDLD